MGDHFQALSERLAHGGPLEDEDLHPLNGLEGASLSLFEAFWRGLGPEQRVALVQAAEALSRENFVLDFQAVGAIAMKDSEPAARICGAQLLAQEAAPEGLDPCLGLATGDPDRHVRAAAIEALGPFAQAAQANTWPRDRLDSLEAALIGELHRSEADLVIRRAALLSLAYLTTPTSEAEIRRASGDPELRDVAVEAMGRNCQDIWIPEIIAALRSDDPEMRFRAVLACIEMEEEALVPHVTPRLQDSELEVQLAAIDALGTIGGNEAVAALLTVAGSTDPELHEAAVEALRNASFREDPFGLAGC